MQALCAVCHQPLVPDQRREFFTSLQSRHASTNKKKELEEYCSGRPALQIWNHHGTTAVSAHSNRGSSCRNAAAISGASHFLFKLINFQEILPMELALAMPCCELPERLSLCIKDIEVLLLLVWYSVHKMVVRLRYDYFSTESSATFAPARQSVSRKEIALEPEPESGGGNGGGGSINPPKGFGRGGDDDKWSDAFFHWWENHNPFSK